MTSKEIFINEALTPSAILQTIKQLDSIEDILDFLDKNQVPVEGRGSSRTVYVLDDDLVVKVAHNKSGIGQNQSERRPEVSGRYGHFLARIYEADHEGKWIVAERVQADEDAANKFFQSLGIESRELWDLSRDFYDVQSYFDEAETQKSRNYIWTDFEDTWKEELANPLVKDILYMYMEYGVRPTDFGIGNVGISNIDGRPLVLDWGYTQDMVKEQKENKAANMSADDLKAVIDMIPTPEGVTEFLQNFGSELGKGSSRVAYEYAPGKAIKIAFNHAGVSQNKAELRHYEDLKPYVPEIYDYHPDGWWIEAEKVEPAKGNIVSHTISFAKRHADPLGVILDKWNQFEKISDRYESERSNIERINNKIPELNGKKDYLIAQGMKYPESFRKSMTQVTQIQDAMKKLEEEEEAAHLILDEIDSAIGPDIIHILRNVKKNNLSRETLRTFVDFTKKLLQKGISDTGEKNVGFSKERGVPVLLDYGYEYSSVGGMYKRNKKEDFDMDYFYKSTSGANPRNSDIGRAENAAGRIGEQAKKERENYIANSTVEEIKRIIEMIPTPEGVIAFLKKFTNNLGTGSSRHAFDIAPGKVLKIAFNKAGLMQNEIELRVADGLGQYAPEIYDHHPEDYWIEMEKADPLGEEGWAISDILSHLAYQDPNQEAILEVERDPRKYEELSELYQELRDKSRNEYLSEEEQMKLEQLSELSDEFSILAIREDYGLSFEMIKHLAGMAVALADNGISDAGPSNLGYSRKTGLPVILDFGFDQAGMSWMYSGYKGPSDTSPDFNPEDYFQATNTMRPAR